MNNNENLEEKTVNFRKDLFDWLDVIISSVIAVIIIFSFLFRVATIKGESMENTLYNDEKVIISDLFYQPKFGDIVVISRNTSNATENAGNSEPIIKRVIATEGQYVDIDFLEGKVYVGYDLANMTLLDEPYIKTPTNNPGNVNFPVYVDEGHIFVLGDNRNESLDSRFKVIGEEGLIDERYVLGRAIFRIYPFDRIGGFSKK